MALFDQINRANISRNKIRSVAGTAGLSNRRQLKYNAKVQQNPDFFNFRNNQISRLNRQAVSARDLGIKQQLQNLQSSRLNDQLKVGGLQLRRDQLNAANDRGDRSLDLQERRLDLSDQGQQFSQDLARQNLGLNQQRLNLAAQNQNFSQDLARQNLGLNQQKLGLAAQNQRFNQDLAQQRQDQSLLAQQQKFQADRQSAQQKARQDFIKNMKPGYVVAQAEKLGIDVSGLYDADENQTLAGDKFLDSVGGYMQRGATEEQAMRLAGGDLMSSQQQQLEQDINTLQEAKANETFQDGTEFSGVNELELEDKERKLQNSAIQLHRLNPEAKNPARDKIIKDYDNAIEGALQVSNGVGGGNDRRDNTRRANKVAQFLEQNNIDIDQVGEGLEIFGQKPSETATKLTEILKYYDPELESLYDEVSRQERRQSNNRGLSSLLSAPISRAGGLALSRAMQEEGSPRDLARAKKALEDYLKKKGEIR